MKVLTIGGGTQDIYLRLEGPDTLQITKKYRKHFYMIFASGEKIEVNELLYFTGGGSTNSAISFQRMGFEVQCFCKIGNDCPGNHISSDLKKEGIATDTLIISDEHPSGKSIVINSLTGERTIFAFRGANAFLTSQEVPSEAIKTCELLYITSLSHDSSLLLPNIVKHAKKYNIKVAINPGTSQLAKGTKTLKESLSYIDILILNSSEAKTFMGALIETDAMYKELLACLKDEVLCPPKLLDKDLGLILMPIPYENFFLSMKNFFREIHILGPSIVVVTDGNRGVYVAEGEEILFYPSLKTEVVDTLGAGDAFGSCFVGCLSLGKSMEDALRYGNTNSASVIGHFGAKHGLLTFDALEEKAKIASPKKLLRFKL